jgi:hypothetical protein
MPEELHLHELVFKKPAGTSRGVLRVKPSWILKFTLPNGSIVHTEFPVIPGLSPEYVNHQQYAAKLSCFLAEARPSLEHWSGLDFYNEASFLQFVETWNGFPSFIFGLEILLLGLRSQGSPVLWATPFTESIQTIPINGLVWMGALSDMRLQAFEKVAAGFETVKLKIGALDWPEELRLLQELRSSAPTLTIRVDANGAFTTEQVPGVLDQLAILNVHSIEQPIAAGQSDAMAALCASTPVPIALDEELIGVSGYTKKSELLDQIRPQYIILKPSLHGGFMGVREWISIAEEKGIGWWLTSALESSIGLSAIVQFGACYDLKLPQGFGTGGLYTNNFESYLTIHQGHIRWINDSHKG